MNKKKITLFEEILLNVLGFVGFFGWYFAIWIEEFRWEIFFTSLISLILALLFTAVLKEKRVK